MRDDDVRRRAYQTSIDRAGRAIAAGGVALGLIEAGLALAGGNGVLGAVLALMLGSLMSALAITAVAVPVWLPLHWWGRRGPGDAALAGAVAGFLLFLAAQMGSASLYGDDDRALAYRWASAAATSLLVAAITAAVALLMWRVAYRRGA